MFKNVNKNIATIYAVEWTSYTSKLQTHQSLNV